MWKAETRRTYDRKGLRYPTDMTDAEWAELSRQAKHATAPIINAMPISRWCMSVTTPHGSNQLNGGACPRGRFSRFSNFSTRSRACCVLVPATSTFESG